MKLHKLDNLSLNFVKKSQGFKQVKLEANF